MVVPALPDSSSDSSAYSNHSANLVPSAGAVAGQPTAEPRNDTITPPPAMTRVTNAGQAMPLEPSTKSDIDVKTNTNTNITNDKNETMMKQEIKTTKSSLSSSSPSADAGAPKQRTVTSNTSSKRQNKDLRLPPLTHRNTSTGSTRTTSVFDRLYKTSTAATSGQQVPKSLQRDPKYSHTKIEPALEEEIVFERVSVALATSHGLKSPTSPMSALTGFDDFPPCTPDRQMQVFERAKSPTRSIPSSASPFITPNSRRSPRVSYVYSPRMKPLTKLYFDSKYHPGLGLETIDPIRLGYSFFQSFCDYENGRMTEAQVAREIIIAFFKKDFPSLRHWDLHEPSIQPLSGDENAYVVRMTAIYDWVDGYREAEAKGIVRCSRLEREVRVLNYTYDINSAF